ncbi:MAG TPA: hypothetical protein PK124_06435 [Bacteroidales bacterium]|nr:hypothetical protein [Bacteroidales bacterium]
MKYYNNGILAFELDYKNNLPYNLIQTQDINGHKLDSNTLIAGNGKLNCYYENGSLLSSFEYKNQLIAGKFYRYYESGDIMEEGLLYTDNTEVCNNTKPIEHCEDLNLFSDWQLNVTTGTYYSVFNDDGSLKYKVYSSFNDSINDDVIISENYKNEKLSHKVYFWRKLVFGQLNTFYENGSLKASGNYSIIDKDSIKISVRNGIFKHYYSNGVIKAEINYSNGKETGTSFYYDDYGILRRTRIIKSNGEIYNIFDNDTVNRIDEKGRKQGKWINIAYLPYLYSECDCSNIPDQILYFKNDKPIGTWEFFNLEGEILIAKIFWKDSINAYYQRWNLKKRLIEEGNLVNMIKDGEWKEYDYKKGYLKWKGYYNCGKKDGYWQEFNRRGKVIREVEYIDGQVRVKRADTIESTL